jgi:Flp pilus assembly protein TadD
MVRQDHLGNVVSAGSAAALAGVDAFVGGLLAYETRAEAAIGAADADPGCCLANVYAGFLWMMLEHPDGPPRALRYLAAAERAAGSATQRERLNLGVLRAWGSDDLPGALALCDRISDEFPRDLAIVKLHQYLEFNRGNSPAMLRVALKVAKHNADVPYLHGMSAFAYEQCHLLEHAERAADTALALKAKEPWAQHALAHVRLTQGRIDTGATLLESAAATWTDLNSFMSTHLWWHLALFYLSQGRDAQVLELYDRRCWGIAKSYSQDQIGAVSLLARCELAGIDVGSRWQDLGEHLAARGLDTSQPFLSLQYLYGLARARRPEAERLLEAVRERAQTAPAFSQSAWREVALPACIGLAAHARGDYETAWVSLGASLPRHVELGGSHAQRDLFEQILIDAAARSGRCVAAQQLLERRRATDPHGVPLNAALAAVYEQLELPDLAAAARARSQADRARHSRQAH